MIEDMRMTTKILMSSKFHPLSRFVSADYSPSDSQDRLQIGYVCLTNTLPWFHKRGAEIEYDDYLQLLKMVGHLYLTISFAMLTLL
jgi:hypothetical protein